MTVFFIILAVVVVLVCAWFITGRILFENTFSRVKPASFSKAKNFAAVVRLRGLFSFLSDFAPYREFLDGEQDWFRAQPAEDVSVTSFDGLTLRAKYLAAENPIGTVIMFHGYRSTGLDDFAPVLRKFHERGMNILLPSQRACDKSEGEYIAFGINERFDCQKWCEYISSRDTDLPILLMGLSLGCSTVLMASGLELPKNVRGVIGDCGFTSPVDEITYVIKNYVGLPAGPIIEMMNFWAKRIGKFDMYACSTVDAMKENKLPVMFAHGDADKFVPCEMSKRCYEACTTPKSILLSPDAGHAMAYLKSTGEYDERITEFIEKYVR